MLLFRFARIEVRVIYICTVYFVITILSILTHYYINVYSIHDKEKYIRIHTCRYTYVHKCILHISKCNDMLKLHTHVYYTVYCIFIYLQYVAIQLQYFQHVIYMYLMSIHTYIYR